MLKLHPQSLNAVFRSLLEYMGNGGCSIRGGPGGVWLLSCQLLLLETGARVTPSGCVHIMRPPLSYTTHTIWDYLYLHLPQNEITLILRPHTPHTVCTLKWFISSEYFSNPRDCLGNLVQCQNSTMSQILVHCVCVCVSASVRVYT